MRVYVDTNVFISSIRQEISRNLQPLGEESDLFFTLCQRRNITIVISGLFLDEVYTATKLSPESIFEFFLERKITFELIQASALITEKASQMRTKTGIHFSDGLHAAMAISTGVEYIITWNLRDFKKVEEFITVLSPRAFLDIF